MRELAVVAFSAVVLSACVTQAPVHTEPPKPEVINYRCADDVSMTVIYAGRATGIQGTAELNWDSHSFALKQTESGSGATYTDGTLTLFTKGDEAFVEKAGERVLRDCNAQL